MSGGITPTYDWALKNAHISSEYVRETLAELFGTFLLLVRFFKPMLSPLLTPTMRWFEYN